MDRSTVLNIALSLLVSGALSLDVQGQKGARWTSRVSAVRFAHVSVEQGLSQSSVLCILQDRRGFLWFGTEDGLNRYDGHDFRIYRTDPADLSSLGGNTILSLYEDRNGVLWIGTSGGGLARYERETDRFVRYTHDPRTYDLANPRGLSDNDVRCILEDRHGSLWIGTDGSGLSRVIRQNAAGKEISFVSYEGTPEFSATLNRNYVSALYRDRKGVLWAGTEDGGLICIPDGGAGDFVHYLPDPRAPAISPSNKITALGEDGQGNLWVGTQDGLCRFDSTRRTFSRHKRDPRNPRSLSHDYVRTLYRDAAGVLWIGTDGGGLTKMMLTGKGESAPEFINFRHDPKNPDGLSDDGVESIYEDRSGVLWVGTYNGGLNKLILRNSHDGVRERGAFIHYASNPLDPHSLSHSSVNAILEDSRGTLWIGTDGGGLNQVVPPEDPDAPLRFVHEQARPGGLSDNVVTSIYEDSQGNLWIGTFTGGLSRLVRGQRGMPPFRYIQYRNHPGDPGSLSSNFVKTIHEDHLQTLWVGTIDGGLNRFDRKTGRFTRYEVNDSVPGNLSDNSVFAICDDREGRLWIGTAEGLNEYDRQRNTFIHYKSTLGEADSLSSNLIRAIYQDRSGTLWVGTEGGGLNRLISAAKSDQRARFKHYRMKDGLPNDTVLGILEDDGGALWLSTHKGLSRFDPKTETFRNYDRQDGLQGHDFHVGACAKNRDGEMFFGGSHGLNIFHPDRIQDNMNIPSVALVDFQLFNKSVPIQGRQADGRTILLKSITDTLELPLSHRDTVFSFQFAALHFVAPEKNGYAYMLEGLEKSWNYVGNRRFATYTAVPPGDYVFRVKGSNSDGHWNPQGVSLRLRVTPPIWRTRWFYGLTSGSLLALGFTLYRVKIRQLRRREAALQAIVEERTRQLESANQMLSRANTRLRRMATRDELTRIANIRMFHNFLQREWRRVVRNALPISLIMADVDFFKLYNDTYGHSAGDECLRQVAKTIRRYANRPGDLAARYGGEEFILILAETDHPNAALIAERIRQDVEGLKIPHARSSVSPYVTISLGCVTLAPRRDDQPDLLLKEVDNALYLSKHQGRNRITCREITADHRRA